ncbi:MAG: YdcF family protein [Commensalibacter sp.]|nr:YdcF family protein [Commensalibacter sp.]
MLSFSFIPPLTDGIVVLTGGTGRIHTAIRFLEKDCSQYLLISGVGATTTLQDLKNSITNFPAISCQDHILLGHNATSTMGNAIETAAWVHYYRLQSLTVITSNYHMRRAILELRNLLYDIPLYPFSINTINKDNILKISSIRLLFIEYNKLLMAYTGLIHTTKPKHDLINIKH